MYKVEHCYDQGLDVFRVSELGRSHCIALPLNNDRSVRSGKFEYPNFEEIKTSDEWAAAVLAGDSRLYSFIFAERPSTLHYRVERMWEEARYLSPDLRQPKLREILLHDCDTKTHVASIAAMELAKEDPDPNLVARALKHYTWDHVAQSLPKTCDQPWFVELVVATQPTRFPWSSEGMAYLQRHPSVGCLFVRVHPPVAMSLPQPLTASDPPPQLATLPLLLGGKGSRKRKPLF